MMNDVIEIKNSIFDYAKTMNRIVKEITSAEDTMTKIDSELTETDKWSGYTHNQCVSAQALIRDYTMIIKDLVGELEICLNDLTKDVTGFEASSRNVKNWEAW